MKNLKLNEKKLNELKRKGVSLVLAATMMLSLSGCGKKEEKVVDENSITSITYVEANGQKRYGSIDELILVDEDGRKVVSNSDELNVLYEDDTMATIKNPIDAILYGNIAGNKRIVKVIIDNKQISIDKFNFASNKSDKDNDGVYEIIKDIPEVITAGGNYITFESNYFTNKNQNVITKQMFDNAVSSFAKLCSDRLVSIDMKDIKNTVLFLNYESLRLDENENCYAEILDECGFKSIGLNEYNEIATSYFTLYNALNDSSLMGISDYEIAQATKTFDTFATMQELLLTEKDKNDFKIVFDELNSIAEFMMPLRYLEDSMNTEDVYAYYSEANNRFDEVVRKFRTYNGENVLSYKNSEHGDFTDGTVLALQPVFHNFVKIYFGNCGPYTGVVSEKTADNISFVAPAMNYVFRSNNLTEVYDNNNDCEDLYEQAFSNIVNNIQSVKSRSLSN